MNLKSKELIKLAKQKHVVSKGIRINCISKEIIVTIGGLILVFFSLNLIDSFVLLIGIFFLYMGLGLLIVNIFYKRIKTTITLKVSKESITIIMFLIPTFIFSSSILLVFPGHEWWIFGLFLLLSDLFFLLVVWVSHYYYEN